MALQRYHDKIIDYLEARRGERLSIEEIAEGCGLKPRTIPVYLTELRRSGMEIFRDTRSGRILYMGDA